MLDVVQQIFRIQRLLFSAGVQALAQLLKSEEARQAGCNE
jgi:hypothetical protein